MMSKTLNGSCLCGAVTFRLKDDFSMFHLCHCTQCQKITGSAHASNLFTSPDNIEWLSGESLLRRYEYPQRNFTKVFCSECGSGLPFVTQNGKYLLVPAGCLDAVPTIKPQDNIFWSEHAAWYDNAIDAERFDAFPQ